jgi:hypothetical protein
MSKPNPRKSSKKGTSKKDKIVPYVIGISSKAKSVTFTKKELESIPFAVGIPSKAKSVTFTKKQLAALREVERQFELSHKIPPRMHSFSLTDSTRSPEGSAHTTTYWTENRLDSEWDHAVDQNADD